MAGHLVAEKSFVTFSQERASDKETAISDVKRRKDSPRDDSSASSSPQPDTKVTHSSMTHVHVPFCHVSILVCFHFIIFSFSHDSFLPDRGGW